MTVKAEFKVNPKKEKKNESRLVGTQHMIPDGLNIVVTSAEQMWPTALLHAGQSAAQRLITVFSRRPEQTR